MKKVFIFFILLISLTGCYNQSYDPISDVLDSIKIVSETAEDFNLILLKENVELKWSSNNSAIKIEGNKAIVTQGAIDTNVKLSVEATKNELSSSKIFDIVVVRDINFPLTTTIGNTFTLEENSYVKFLDVTVQNSSKYGTYFTDGLDVIYAPSIYNLEENASYEVIGKKVTNPIATLENVTVTQIVSTAKYLEPVNSSLEDIKIENGFYTISGILEVNDNNLFIKSNENTMQINGDLELFVGREVTLNAYVSGDGSLISFCNETELNLSDNDLLDVVYNNLTLVDYTRYNIRLITSSLFNSAISWTSSNNDTLSNDGTVNRKTENTNVVLTASIKYNNITKEKQFNITVISSENNYLEELFISEYYEGLNSDKYIEIYNPTDLIIDLSDYSLKIGVNGASFSTTYQLQGELLPSEVYVLYNSSCRDELVQAMSSIKSNTGSAVTSFNGNDCIGLFKEDVLIDIFGIEGDYQEKYWEIPDSGNTVDHRIVRNITTGASTIWNTAEWTATKISSTSELNIDNLGLHCFV